MGATLVNGDTFNLFDWGTVSGTFSARSNKRRAIAGGTLRMMVS